MKVTCPNPRLTQKEALESLYAHPKFPKNARVVEIKRVKGRWEAELTEGTRHQAAPPFPPAGKGPEEGPPEDVDIEVLKPSDDEDDSGEDKSDDKDLDKLFDLVKQIAEKVGVNPDGEKEELDKELDDGEEPPVPPKPPAAPAPKPPPPRPGLRPGMAPPGTTPVGAPSFASVLEQKKIATFEVSDETDVPLSEAERQINDKYAEYGYKVKKLIEDIQGEKRVVRAQVSCR